MNLGARLAKIVAAVAIVATLAATSAVAGRVLLPDIGAILPTQPRAETDPDYRSLAREYGQDFDAIVRTMRDGISSEGASRSMTIEWSSINLPARTSALRGAVLALPATGAIGRARAHYVDALDLVRSTFARSWVLWYLTSARLRDILNRAEAEWQKGDDLLR